MAAAARAPTALPRVVLGTAARAMGTHASPTDMSSAGLNGMPSTRGGGGGGGGAQATLAELIEREVRDTTAQ